MESQKCEICGEWKETKEMSESYKHRCKACVAELTRKSHVHISIQMRLTMQSQGS